MAKKPLIYVLVLAVSLFFTGCAPLTFQNINDLLRAPALGQGQGEIQEALAANLNQPPQYKYPIEGDLRSPLLMADLNGDGTEEGVLAYSLPASKPEAGSVVHLAVLEWIDNQWVVTQKIKGTGTEVASLQVADILGNGTQQLLAGFGNAGLTSKTLSIFSYSEQQLVLERNMAYSRYELGDFTGRGGTDMVVVSPDDKLDGLQLQYVSTVDGQFGEPQPPVLLDGNFEKCIGIYPSRGNDGQPLIVVDGMLSTGVISSQLIYYAEEHFYSDPTRLRGESPRMSSLLKSNDIDGDGIVEIPRRVGKNEITTFKGDKNLEYIEWVDFTMSGLDAANEPVIKQFGLLDSDLSVYIRLPDQWRDNIKVTDGSGASEWRIQKADSLETLLTLVLQPANKQPRDALAVPGYPNCWLVPGDILSKSEQQVIEIVPLA